MRAHVPINVLRDLIQPFPTFYEIYVSALNGLHGRITDRRAKRRDNASRTHITRRQPSPSS